MTTPAANNRPLVLWLAGCAALVCAMIVVGAITRLTGSGLSITEWKPVTGALPPLNERDWSAAFDLYKQSPQYIKENFWMDLADFKRIFFWEWFHRLLGRLIGFAYALPLAYFWLRKKIPAGYGWKLLGVLALGGAQGLMGWLMVASGLVDRPDVSHFRLAAHLLLALGILVSMLLLTVSLAGLRRHPSRPLYLHGCAALALLGLTICWGAFTAGLDAGLLYNDSFPKMGGRWVPAEVASASALIASPAGVQFVHRWLALTTAAAILALWGRAAARGNGFTALHALAAVIVLQAGLGIATLLSGVFIPLAVLHQAGAVTALLLLTVSLYQLRS